MDNKTENIARIKIQEHGSYLVTGGVKLTTKTPVSNAEGERVDWADGNDYPDKIKFSLCRCGHSKNKPYCDSSHKVKNFDGTLISDRGARTSREIIYDGAGITMTDDESICAGYAYCDRFGSVWTEIEQTDKSVVKERIEKQISMCPSGRLAYYLDGKREPVEKEYEPTIACIPDGPLWILGNIPVEAPDGFDFEIRNRLLLCRCGHSGNKPFCDGSHWNLESGWSE